MIKNVFQIIMMLYPLIVEFIEEAEELIDGAGQGVAKKEWVLDALETVLKGIAFYKQGTAEYQEMVLNIAGYIIDSVVGIYNSTGAWGRSIKIELNEGDQLQ
jgi:hypothetical protein